MLYEGLYLGWGEAREYRQVVIGTLEDSNDSRQKGVLEFFKRHYLAACITDFVLPNCLECHGQIIANTKEVNVG